MRSCMQLYSYDRIDWDYIMFKWKTGTLLEIIDPEM